MDVFSNGYHHLENIVRGSDEDEHTYEITEANVKHLDDLLCAIENKNPKKSWSDDVNGIFFRCQQYEQRYSDYHKLQDHPSGFLHSNHINGLVHLLRESILSHQWTDAIKIVHTLVKEDSMAEIIWKAGMASLIREKKIKSIDLYARQLCSNTQLTHVEVLFDYLLYLLTEGNLDTAKNLTQDLSEMKDVESAEIEYLKLLFRAYLGLIDYIQWKAETVQEDAEDETAVDFISSQLSQGFSHQSSKVKAEKAIHNLSCVRGIPGVWDIFIVKMVEIHEFYNELETARSLLKDYKATNPDNLNAHRYLYKFEMKHKENADEKLQSLKSIIRLDPSNPLALELYKNLESSDPEAVSILFDYLDFHHCENDLQAWKLLKTHLSEVKGNDQTHEAVTRCWALRIDWWPNSTLQLDDDSDEKLAKVKKKVHKNLKKYFTPQMT